MKTLVYTGEFKGDLKRFRNQPDKIKKLHIVLSMLENEEMIPAIYRPHRLKGDMAGYFECHIGFDLLLVWMEPNTKIIKLVGFGSHSVLFSRRR